MRYTLGLDIGIASVGWAVLNHDRKRIEDLGARAFAAAENPKNQSPLAEPRRLARGARRRLRRKAGRLRGAKDLFVQHGLIAEEVRDSAFAVTNDKRCPWQLRAEGLERLLTGEELARALYHIVKHRGFKSNRKGDKDKEDGKMLAGIQRNKALLENGGYRTAGELYWKDEAYQTRKRNSHESYLNTIDRDTLEHEIITLFRTQRDLGSGHAGPDLESGILEVFRWQNPFATGDAILKLVGPCTFLGKEGKIRAPKCGYHAERFRLLQDINKLSYSVNGDRPRLTTEQRTKIEQAAYSHIKLTYEQVRKLLDLKDEARFTGLDYMRRPAKGEPREFSMKCEDATAFQARGYHAIRKACEKAGVWETVQSDPDLMDDMAFALTFYKTNEDIQNHLTECGAHEPVIQAALACETFTGVMHISTKAAKRIIPFLEEGLVYSAACEKAGFDHSNPEDHERSLKLPLITRDMVSNPVVHRSLCQARRIVNAVVRRYGSPYSIHIEFARDVGRNPEQRKEIKQQQEENRRERERNVEHFKEAFDGYEPNGTDLLKWRLYREQCGQCAYSQQAIDIKRLMESGYVEIDHILPYSRSFDDGRSNKALVFARENQNKRNQTPHEAFSSDPAKWQRFEAWVRAAIKDPRKRDNLLRENYDAEVAEEWKTRHLNDTRYAAREFKNHVGNHLIFADVKDGRQPVVCLSGLITATARRLWGLEKHREENDLHHAMDAAVVAALLPHQVQMITEWAKVGETRESYVDYETGEIIEATRPRLPQPWTAFRKEIVARLSGDPQQAIAQLGLTTYDGVALRPILVSRMVRRGTFGELHKATIYSTRVFEDKDGTVTRTALTDLKKASLVNLVCKETDPALYRAICSAMEQADHDGKRAFSAGVAKPCGPGKTASVVHHVKVWQSRTTGISMRGGVAFNDSMAYIRVFCKDDAYCFVPVYVAEIAEGELPNKAIAGRTENDWLEMDSTYAFCFDLHKYDLVGIETKEEQYRLWYYRECDRNDGRLSVSEPNVGKLPGGPASDEVDGPAKPKARLPRISPGKILRLEKYEIDVLGDYRPAPKEKRSGLKDNSHLETGEAEC